MKPEHLESLLLDRELGELSPAATALLEEYLARHPEATDPAKRLTATVDLARQALATPPAPALRPLDLARLESAERATMPVLFRPELYRLAASLALGLGIGWLIRPLPSPVSSADLPAGSSTLVVSAPAEPRSQFWSVSRRTASARLSAPSGSNLRQPFR